MILKTLTFGFVSWLLLGTGSARAAEGMSITVTNSTTDNILVTVYDRNTGQMILSRRALYGNASITISVVPDDSGHGHVSWTAITADPNMRECGQGDRSTLNEGDMLNVHADDDCN